VIRLLKIITVAAVVWSLYWVVAGFGIRSGIEGWFSAQSDRGWQAEYSDISAGGYPLQHITRIDNPVLADPASGLAWSAAWLTLESPGIWPGRQTLRFAPDPQRLSYFDQTSVISAKDLEARLDLAPGVALELRELALEGGLWRIQNQGSDLIGADTLLLGMVQTEQAETYRIDLLADSFRPGRALRRLMGAAPDIPDQFGTLAVELDVRFDRVWDRQALEDRRPQPRQISVRQAEAHWGPMRLRAAGDLEVDAHGIPSGALNLRAENWRQMLHMAQLSGALPAGAANAAEQVLGMLAGLGGNQEDLDIQINFRDGFVALGPLPLGPAPRLVLR